MNDLIIRTATPDDAPALVGIYSYYVTETAVSFEYDVPTEKEFRERITRTLTRYPYLAAEKDGVSYLIGCFGCEDVEERTKVINSLLNAVYGK